MKKILIIIYMLFKRVIYKIRNKTKISLLAYFDDNCSLGKRVYIERFCILHDVNVEDYSYIAYNSSIYSCEIGKFCSISSDVKIGLANHPINMVSTSPIFYSRKNRLGVRWSKNELITNKLPRTIIGNDVWIGTNAIIMSGLKIGDGAIIAAGAIVTKDVEPYSIVAGVPAKVIKKRFDNTTINNLMKIKWWNWDIKKIKDECQLFESVEMFFNRRN